mmetsp:Transcript_56840/g.83401  ORF Transcript_56840/g.83401 Transcript_56840/m.83401 type:complete len:375 (+) Transcript_56840:40-1164(+)
MAEDAPPKVSGDLALASMKNSQLLARAAVLNSSNVGQTAPSGAMSQGQKRIALMSLNREGGQDSSMQAKLQQLSTSILPLLNKLLVFIDAMSPYLVKAWDTAQTVYKYTPLNIIEAIYGLALCFFGGLYPLTIAAGETFRVSGGDRVQNCLSLLWTDLRAVHQANMLDNKKDDDGDGIADIDQISQQELMTRKMALVLKTVNPNRILQASGGLAQAFAGVCATLKLQFARVISLAVSISDSIRPLLVQFLAPALVAVIPSDYHHWIFPMIDVTCKIIGGSIAWFLFRILAAVHSGILGGLMCARALLRYANNMKWLTLNADETMMDEYAGWTLAALGVYFQVSNGMAAPFPLNILFLPVTFCETYLQWLVTWMN